MKRLTIAMVQVGDYLGRGAEYVAKLVDGVRRNLPADIEARFVCFTDDPATLPEGVEAKAVLPGITGWWNKILMLRAEAFAPGERVLFFDLDTIITGSLAEVAAYDGPFAIMRDVFQPEHFQSSVMAWEAGRLDHVWARWDAAGRPQFDPHGDQRWIEAMMPFADRWQDMLPGQFVSFKRDAHPLGGLPPDARVLVFHGRPRPHETGVPWVSALWNRRPDNSPADKAA